MAYVLGYFAADGCMNKNRRGAHFIEFQTIDKDSIEQLRSTLNSAHKVSIRKYSPKHSKLYRLQIGSKDMYNDLITLGFTPAKSNVLEFPTMPVSMFPHFTRGYFDGDGHVSVCSYKRRGRNAGLSTTIISGFTSGSKNFLVSLHNKLKRYAKISGGSLYFNKGYRLNFSVNDSKKLYEFIYGKNKILYLTRKREIFRNYFK